MTVKLDGRPLSDFGIELMSPAIHPMTPPTDDITLKVPGRDGLYHFGSTFGARNFSFECGVIREIDEIEMQKKLRVFTAFILDSYGKPREIQLTFDYEPDKYYLVKFAGQLSAERFYSVGSFTLTFTAYDPFAYADMLAYSTPSYYDQAEEGMYYENTINFQWEYMRHYSGVHNYSSINTPLIIEIEGTMLNPSITHLESGKKLVLPSIYSSRKIEINTEKYTITSNGFNILFETNGEFLTLSPGDNGFLFEADSPNAKVTYKWKHKYI